MINDESQIILYELLKTARFENFSLSLQPSHQCIDNADYQHHIPRTAWCRNVQHAYRGPTSQPHRARQGYFHCRKSQGHPRGIGCRLRAFGSVVRAAAYKRRCGGDYPQVCRPTRVYRRALAAGVAHRLYTYEGCTLCNAPTEKATGGRRLS